MALYDDDKTALLWEKESLYFDLQVRDSLIHTANAVANHVNSLESKEVIKNIINQIDFFDNDYLPEWIKRYEYFYPRKDKLNVITSRFDFVLHNNVPKLVELNTACPAGHVFYPIICKKQLRSRKEIISLSCQPETLFSDTLIKQALTKSKNPVICLVTSNVNTISNELKELRDQIIKKGYRCFICHIQRIKRKNQALFYNGIKIDLIWFKFNDQYKNRLLGLIDNDPRYLQTVLNSYLEGTVDIINPPLAFYLFEDKAFLRHFKENLDKNTSDHIAYTEIIRRRDRTNKKFWEEIIRNKNSYILKPRIGTRADYVESGKYHSNQSWERILHEIGPKSHVVQRFCNNKDKSGNSNFKTISVMMYEGKPAAITGRCSTKFPVSAASGAKLFVFCTKEPEIENKNRLLAAFNKKYFSEKTFPGYGNQRVRIFKDLLRIYDIIFKYTRVRKVANKIKYFNTRPDLYIQQGQPYVLELNIDSAISPQSHIAYLQHINNLKIQESTGQFNIPFVESLKRLLERINGPVAILGSNAGADIYDPLDEWLVNKIKQTSMLEIKFYPAQMWRNLGKLNEPYFIRWLSVYQIKKDHVLFCAYNRLLKRSRDLVPWECNDIAGSKTILAELHNLVKTDVLTKKQKMLIKRYIPWTAILILQGTYVYKGKKIKLDYFLENKDHFVIKKIHSHQSKDVYIGKILDNHLWRKVVNRYALTGKYIIQQYIENDLEISAKLKDLHGNTVIRKLNYMISPFIMGHNMAGTYVRAWNDKDAAFSFNRRIVSTTNDFVFGGKT